MICLKEEEEEEQQEGEEEEEEEKAINRGREDKDCLGE